MSNILEKERLKLYELIEQGASKADIQKQSEIVDKLIVEHYHRKDNPHEKWRAEGSSVKFPTC